MTGSLLQQTGVLTLAGYGLTVSAFSVCYAVGRLVNGIIGDHVDAKIMVVGGITLTGLFTALFGTLAPFGFLLVFWGMEGFCQSMLWGPLLVTVTDGFDRKKRTAVGAIFATAVGAGSMLGIVMASSLSEYISLSAAFFVPAAISVLLGLLALAFLKRKKTDRRAPVPPLHRSVGTVELIKVFFVSAFYGIIKDNCTYFAPGIFIALYAVDVAQMSFFVFVIPVLTLVGRMIYPAVYRLCRSNEFVTGAAGFGVIIAATVPLLIGDVPIAVTAASLGIISAASAVIGTTMCSSYPMRYSDTGNVSSLSGFVDFAAYLGSGVGSTVYAAVIIALGYKPMFASFAAFAAVGAAVVLMLGKNRKA